MKSLVTASILAVCFAAAPLAAYGQLNADATYYPSAPAATYYDGDLIWFDGTFSSDAATFEWSTDRPTEVVWYVGSYAGADYGTDKPYAYGFFPIGTTNVTLTVGDGSGAIDSFEFAVTVSDARETSYVAYYRPDADVLAQLAPEIKNECAAFLAKDKRNRTLKDAVAAAQTAENYEAYAQSLRFYDPAGGVYAYASVVQTYLICRDIQVEHHWWVKYHLGRARPKNYRSTYDKAAEAVVIGELDLDLGTGKLVP